MKNLKFVYQLTPLLILYGSLLAVTSCKKLDSLSVTQNKIERINSDLKKINSKFSRKNAIDDLSISSFMRTNSSGDITPPPDLGDVESPFNFKKFCQVLSADAAGAWVGSRLGSKIGAVAGSLIPGAGTATGATAGAVAGAVIIGAVASYGASHIVPDTTLNLLPSAIDELPSTEESADMGHNRILNLMLSSPSTSGEGSGEGEEETYNSAIDTTFLTNNESVVYSDSDCQSLVNNTIYTFSNTQPEIETSKSYVLGAITDNVITTVSNNFFDGMQYLETTEDVLNFINSYELYVSNSIDLDQTQKESIKAALEASKGSLSFWSPLIGH